jgi:hypothetical protein
MDLQEPFGPGMKEGKFEIRRFNTFQWRWTTLTTKSEKDEKRRWANKWIERFESSKQTLEQFDYKSNDMMGEWLSVMSAISVCAEIGGGAQVMRAMFAATDQS